MIMMPTDEDQHTFIIIYLANTICNLMYVNTLFKTNERANVTIKYQTITKSLVAMINTNVTIIKMIKMVLTVRKDMAVVKWSW